MSEPIITQCPICRSQVALGDPHFPFCSDRCREVDLGNWAMEKYTIPGEPIPFNDLDLTDKE
jgi:endogenous inhibitor of DNA gyrase (YacG/DUF329 family)